MAKRTAPRLAPPPRPWRWRCEQCGRSVTRPGPTIDPLTCGNCGLIDWRFWEIGDPGNFGLLKMTVSVTLTLDTIKGGPR